MRNYKFVLRNIKDWVINICITLVVLGVFGGLIEFYIRSTYPIGASYVYSEFTDYLLKPSQQFEYNTHEFETVITINDQGLRDPGMDTSRPCRVLLLGDSYLFGQGVSDDQTFESLLDRRFEREFPGRFTFINTGHNGYDTRREAAFLERFGGRYNPNMILVFITLNDLLQNSGEHQFAPISTNIILRNLPFAGVGALIHYLIKNPGLLMFRIGLTDDYNRPDFFRCYNKGECDNEWAATLAQLIKIKSLADKTGAEVFLINIPPKEHVTKIDFSQERTQDWVSSKLEGLSRKAGIGYRDFGLYKGISPRLYYPHDGHLTPDGNRKIADFIYPTVADPRSCSAR